MRQYNLMIGSCGGLTGVYLAKQFQKYPNIRVLGSDANSDSIGRFFVDGMFHLPPASQENFIPELISLLNKENIDFYLPTHSKETIAVSKAESEIRKSTKTDFIISPYSTYRDLNNKAQAYNCLSKIGIPVPKVYKSDSEIIYPAFYKRKVGSGSAGCGRIFNNEEYRVMAGNEEIFICEFIDGSEYTVDCMFSRKGELLGYNQRKRVKCMGGAVIITSNENSFDIFPYINSISQKWLFKGCVNFQYILGDKPYFTDINLRYASGGMPLSIESGVDIPKALYKIFMNEQIRNNEFWSDFKPRTMYRYFEEKYSE